MIRRIINLCIGCKEELKEHEGRVCMSCLPYYQTIQYKKDERKNDNENSLATPKNCC